MPADSGQSRFTPLTDSINACFTLTDIRTAATDDPGLLPVASEWARRFHPQTTLARATAQAHPIDALLQTALYAPGDDVLEAKMAAFLEGFPGSAA